MEIIAAVIGPVVECASSGAAERWKHHRHIKKNMRSLIKASEKLNRRKEDLKTRLETEIVPGETEETEELKYWLKSVEGITCAIEEIGNETRQVKFLSQAGVGRRVEEMIPEVNNLYEEGDKFLERNLVRTLPRRGNEKPTKAGLFGGDTPAEKTKGEILRCLVDEKATRIGVHGMGGAGKTTVLEHLHNDLLKSGDKIGSKFDKVIWITASKASSVRGLQDKIGRKLELGLDEKDDEEIRATELLRGLKNKRFILIIDDLWEDYPLEKVGVPDPTLENGCKLVLTTRSRDVCSKMECDEIIQMGLLSVEQAEKLFFDKVGKRVASDPILAEMARQFAGECAGLPLAVVTVAGSMRDKMDMREWEVALKELKDATHSASKEITTILRFSYDRLKDEEMKKCIMHCALYPEDHLIDRNSLIYQLIAQGSVDHGRTVKERKEKCHVMLNELVRDCMLIDAVNDRDKRCVKLHDSVRDMAIHIMRESPSRFLVEAKGEGKWDEGLEKVSFTGNNKIIPVAEPPKCPRLSTLLFINAKGLEFILDDFFTRMKGLCVLDLSDTKIKSMPSSVTSLENLVVLSLKYCHNLKCVPNLSELRNLIRLDMNFTGITEYPKGLEKLVKLTHLDLSGVEVEHYRKGLLSELSNLIHLSIRLPCGAGIESAKELAALQNLEYLKVEFLEISLFNAYLRMIPSKSETRTQPCDFIFMVGTVPFSNDTTNSVYLCSVGVEIDGPIMVPNNVENLIVENCVKKSLCGFASVENIINLQTLVIDACEEMEYILYNSPAVSPLLQNIKKLELSDLPSLRALIGPESDGTASLFSSLKKLWVWSCPKLKTLFVVGKEASLPTLEDISIGDCDLLEEIISYENEDAITINLPSLNSIKLSNLPKLKSAQFVADSLSYGRIYECPELKEVTSSLQPFMDISTQTLESCAI